MKKNVFIAMSAMVILSVFVVYLQAREQEKSMMMKQTTIEGTLVDAKCYVSAATMGKPEMNFGNDHMVPGKDGTMSKLPSCATACANMGIPTAIVEGGKPGGKTYIIIAPAPPLAKYMAEHARITGTLTDNGIIPTKAEVKKNGKWEEVSLTTMM